MPSNSSSPRLLLVVPPGEFIKDVTLVFIKQAQSHNPVMQRRCLYPVNSVNHVWNSNSDWYLESNDIKMRNIDLD